MRRKYVKIIPEVELNKETEKLIETMLEELDKKYSVLDIICNPHSMIIGNSKYLYSILFIYEKK